MNKKYDPEILDVIRNFITADGANRVIVMARGFDSYASATLLLAATEFRKNLARAGVIDMELPGSKIDIRVADDDDFSDTVRDLPEDAVAMVVGYTCMFDIYIEPDSIKSPNVTFVLDRYLNDPKIHTFDGETNSVRAIFVEGPSYIDLSNILAIGSNPNVFKADSVIESQMVETYVTSFAKRMRNWLSNSEQATTRPISAIEDLAKGWYKCPMATKEYMSYAAFTGFKWQDIDVIRSRAKSLADMSTGSDVFLRIDASSSMELTHLYELITSSTVTKGYHVDTSEPAELVCVRQPSTPAELAAIAFYTKCRDGVHNIVVDCGSARYRYGPIDGCVDSYAVDRIDSYPILMDMFVFEGGVVA